jgi:hypothetical protein
MNREKLKAFEDELDKMLYALPSLTYDGEECISFTANAIEGGYSLLQGAGASYLTRGLNVLAPHFIATAKGRESDFEQLMHDLHFASHYFILRDYLYYTYNSPKSFSWEFTDSTVVVKFNDKTIPRQFYIQANNHVMGSLDLFSDYRAGERIVELLKGQEEFSYSDDMEHVLSLISEEMDIKLSSYFNFLKSASSTSLGDYSFSDFDAVFRVLLLQSMYHRYQLRANGISGAIYMPTGELITNLSSSTSLSQDVCSAVVRDITYGAEAKASGIQPMYFSLFRLAKADQIVMMPHHFATWEGYINILRITAMKRPQAFLKSVSAPLAKGFADAVELMFSEQGFRCEREVNLAKFDSRLPDIDLLVVSEEPTLGYVVFLCELKSPIPPQWAKDHLRVLNEDSVLKAFQQLDLIAEFLRTERGARFLISKLSAEEVPTFADGFVIALNSLVITSKNAGMFFGDRDHIVINYETLGRILKKCDGDVSYLLTCIGGINEWADALTKISSARLKVGEREVSYEGVEIGGLMEFRQNIYKSAGVDKQMLQQFIEDSAL